LIGIFKGGAEAASRGEDRHYNSAREGPNDALLCQQEGRGKKKNNHRRNGHRQGYDQARDLAQRVTPSSGWGSSTGRSEKMPPSKKGNKSKNLGENSFHERKTIIRRTAIRTHRWGGSDTIRRKGAAGSHPKGLLL